MRQLPALLAALACGCGYVGEPLPPALHIPLPVGDLSAFQRADQILVQFTLPTQSTEGLAIRRMGDIELRMTPAAEPAAAKVILVPPGDSARIEFAVPGAEWIGKEVLLTVRLQSPHGRTAGWSNQVSLTAVPPLAQPRDVSAQAVPEGVRITWTGTGARYRVFRRTGDGPSASPLGEADRAEYLDTNTEYGKTYHYSVQAIQTGGNVRAQSVSSPETAITPEDRFAPAVPAGLAAVASTESIELAWERNTEPDLAGYRVYRAEATGQFEKLADTQESPSYSDRKIERGKTYRYAVAAVDRSGNESKMSAPVETRLP